MKLSPLLGPIVALSWAVGFSLANLLTPLNPDDGAATELSKRFQPALDFDKDSCYHVTALDLHGNYNEGMVPFNPKGNWVCRTPDRLMHSNAYVRRRCNHFWCAYMYAYYFEKDEGKVEAHIHDWEHVIVWTLHNKIFYVSWSAHGNYDCEHFGNPDLHFQDSHLKIVYHLGGLGTHSMRLATGNDEPPENAWGKWFIAWLVEVTAMEPWSKNLVLHDWGHAHPDIGDRFGQVLKDWAPWDAIHNEGFDPWSDAETWTTKHVQKGLRVQRKGSRNDAIPYNRTISEAPIRIRGKLCGS